MPKRIGAVNHYTPKPYQLRALLDGAVSTLVVPLVPQPEPWKDYHLEGGCQVSDWSFEIGPYTEDGRRFQTGLWMHCRFHESRFQALPLPIGKPVWIREAWCHFPANAPDGMGECTYFRAESSSDTDLSREIMRRNGIRWRSPATMPRWASRLTIVPTEARVCRLQEVTEEEARAGGVEQWATVGDARTSGGLAWGEIPEGVPDDAIFWIADYDSTLSEDADRAVTLDPREAFRARWTADNPADIPLLDEDGRKIGMQPNPCRWGANPWVAVERVEVHHTNIDRMAKEDAA